MGSTVYVLRTRGLGLWQIFAPDSIRAGLGLLKPVELNLLKSMNHWSSEPSEKQSRWLNAIASALGMEVGA